jgi:hypothetical protein
VTWSLGNKSGAVRPLAEEASMVVDEAEEASMVMGEAEEAVEIILVVLGKVLALE